MKRSCQDYISDLSDYIDGAADPGLCAEIEKHLGECENCRIMVDSLKQTVTLCRDGKPEALPEALEKRLNSLLKARWDKKFGRSS